MGCPVWTYGLAFLHTILCILSIVVPDYLWAFLCLLWILLSKLNLNNLSKKIYATLTPDKGTLTFDATSSLWGKFIEVAFPFNKLQLMKSKDSWKILFVVFYNYLSISNSRGEAFQNPLL